MTPLTCAYVDYLNNSQVIDPDLEHPIPVPVQPFRNGISYQSTPIGCSLFLKTLQYTIIEGVVVQVENCINPHF